MGVSAIINTYIKEQHMSHNVVAMILAGGKGTRLGLLTKKMAKPAVSFAARYRIIDFPLSNCANSPSDCKAAKDQIIFCGLVYVDID